MLKRQARLRTQICPWRLLRRDVKKKFSESDAAGVPQCLVEGNPHKTSSSPAPARPGTSVTACWEATPVAPPTSRGASSGLRFSTTVLFAGFLLRGMNPSYKANKGLSPFQTGDDKQGCSPSRPNSSLPRFPQRNRTRSPSSNGAAVGTCHQD